MKLRPQSRHVIVLSLKLTANLLFFVFGSQSLAGAVRLAFDPTFPGAIIASANCLLVMARRGPAPAWKSGEKVGPPDQPVILLPCQGVSLWWRTICCSLS